MMLCRNRSSEVEITNALQCPAIVLHQLRVHLRIVLSYLIKLFDDEVLSDPPGLFAGEVIQPFSEGKDRIELAELSFEAAFEHIHDLLSGPATAIPCGTEGGDHPHLCQFPDDLIKAPAVPDDELLPLGVLLLSPAVGPQSDPCRGIMISRRM